MEERDIRSDIRRSQNGLGRTEQGAALLETLFATSFFTIATLALIASTLGMFHLNESQDRMASIVSGAHSVVEQILASDFSDPAFQHGATIPGTQVPATANVVGLEFRITRNEIDECTNRITISCFINNEPEPVYTTSILKTCPDFLPGTAYSMGNGNNEVYSKLNELGIPAAISPPNDNGGNTGDGNNNTAGAGNAEDVVAILPPPGGDSTDSGGGGGCRAPVICVQ